MKEALPTVPKVVTTFSLEFILVTVNSVVPEDKSVNLHPT